MVRSDKNWPALWFGRPGALTQLPYSRGGIDREYDRPVYDFVTASGQHQVQLLAEGSRLHALAWNALHVDTYSLLEQYWLGNMGVGPWAYIDPAMTNMLLPNQAGATSVRYDTTGFATSDGLVASGSLFSVASPTVRPGAPRAVRWQFTVTAATTPVLTLNAPYRNWYGFPAVPGQSYAFSLQGRADGVVDSSITMAVKVQWYDSTGTQIGSDVSGGDIVMSATYGQLSVVAVAPTNTAFIKPICVATGSTITTGASIYLDQLMLEQDTVVNTWAPGAGARPVELVSLTDPVPFNTRFRKGVTMQLRELAR
jgi:hypothetical protein